MLLDRLDNWGVIALILASLFTFAVALWLMLREGKGHPNQETEIDSTDYADIVRTGHAPLGLFLVLFITGIIIWTIVYFVLHWSEFAAIGRGTVY